MIRFVAKKRIEVADDGSTVTIQGKHHTDRMKAADLDGRIALYQKLHAKRPQFYAASLAAARAAREMLDKINSQVAA